MAMTNMLAFTGNAFESGGGFFTASWTIELEPHDSFAQVTLADYWEMDDKSSAIVAISRLTHRKANGKDKAIAFLSTPFLVDTAEMTRIAGDPKMSSISIVMGAENIYANWILQIFQFD